MLEARYHVYDSAVLDAPIEEAWRELRDVVTLLPVVFGDAVKDYRYVDGGSAEKIPSRFEFTLHPSGETAQEEVVARSETEHSLTYRLLGQVLGIEGYIATYRLRRITTEPDKTFLEWPREFGVAAGHDPAAVVPSIAALTAKEVLTIKAYFAKRRRSA
ncbi:SRPBCC family protein [Sorangium sp. So ce1389]|uniref:SRPBCC family protein n=1 Tax=Sorangium sp. So ce1389 TaxID=3133336 RepID=UPI003F5F8CC8